MKPTIEPLKIGLLTIKKQLRKEEKWEKTFKEMFDGYPIFQVSNNLISSIIDILKIIYKENYKDDIISWWVYEKECGRRKDLKMYEKGGKKEIPSDTIEDLYNYLIKFNFKDDMEELNELVSKYKFEYHEPIIRYTDDKTQHNPPWTIYVEGKIKYPDGKEEDYQLPWQVSVDKVKFNK